jgi:DNA-nicking Smr family endonuclease
MATPQLDDDGSKVTLDLHGLSVDEAIDLTYSTLRLAENRGRNRLKVIHGSSNTQAGQRRTIKNALHALLDQGNLASHATSVMRSRDTLTFVLDLTASSDPTPIKLRDIRA